jgi:predicted enzyme related to lactoylglutathione lyase
MMPARASTDRHKECDFMSSHPIVHVEFPATEPAAAGRFYRDLFGWQVAPAPGMGDYLGFRAAGGPGGGFARVDGERVAPGCVLAYVATDDIDASLARAEALGGMTVLPKTEIAGMGWIAIFSDPTGNQVGLFCIPSVG